MMKKRLLLSTIMIAVLFCICGCGAENGGATVANDDVTVEVTESLSNEDESEIEKKEEDQSVNRSAYVIVNEKTSSLYMEEDATYSYDADGRILERTGSRTDSGLYEYNFVEKYEYDESGLLVCVIRDSMLVDVYKYDDRGNLINITQYYGESREMVDYTQEGMVLEDCTYEYDAEGRIAVKLNPNGNPYPAGKFEYFYDEEGKLEKVIGYACEYDETWNFTGNYENRASFEDVYEYNEAKQLIKKTNYTYYYDYENIDTYYNVYVYKYDDNGNLINEKILSELGEVTSEKTYEWALLDDIIVQKAAYTILDIKNASVGDIVTFGTWNGTPCEWDILEMDGEKALIISHYVLEDALFHDDELQDANWSESYLRAYMNGEMMTELFDGEEAAKVLTVKMSNPSSEEYWTNYTNAEWLGELNPCPETEDKLFLLNWEEVVKFYGELDGNVSNGWYLKNAIAFNMSGKEKSWWLRDRAIYGEMAIGKNGAAFNDTYPYAENGVRPALYVEY